MQLDAVQMRPVLSDCGRRGTFDSVLGRCATPPHSTRTRVQVCAGKRVFDSLQIGCVPARPRSKWNFARLPLADAMARVRPCVQVSGTLLCLAQLQRRLVLCRCMDFQVVTGVGARGVFESLAPL